MAGAETKKYVIDTNSLINNPYIIKEKNVVLTSIVLKEIENLELKKMDRNLQYSIRVAKRLVNDMLLQGNIKIVDAERTKALKGYSEDYADNIIVSFAVQNNYGIITEDILLKFKAMSMGVEVIRSTDQEDNIEYKGFKVIDLNVVELAEIYQNLDVNKFDLNINEYLAITVDGEFRDAFVWTGEYLENILKKDGKLLSIPESGFFEKLEAKDIYQSMVIHSMNKNQVTMIRGMAGSGKSLLALSHAWKDVSKNDGRLVIFFNPAPSKDSIEMGFFKGDLVSKAMQSSLGAMLRSKFGDVAQVEILIAKGTIEILPFTDLRGWDATSERNTTVLISEAQNLTGELMKLGLQRMGDKTKVIIDGDYNQQVDRDIYVSSNGMKRASEVLRGSKLYGEIELQNVYRSELASLVEGM